MKIVAYFAGLIAGMGLMTVTLGFWHHFEGNWYPSGIGMFPFLVGTLMCCVILHDMRT